MAGWGFMKEVVLDFYFFQMEETFARMTENGFPVSQVEAPL